MGVHFFVRGAPEAPLQSGAPQWQAGIFDLLSAYAGLRQNAPWHMSRCIGG